MENTKYILNFLTQLSQNNNREWFTENKPQYQQAHEYFISIVEQVISELAKTEPEMERLDPKKCVFRIYRDTRFSKDKTPYKTNFGASFFMGQSKGISEAGYYMHFEPGKSFIAAGLYQPNSDVLKKFRKEISYNKEEFLSIIENPTFKKNFKIEGEKLKKIPQGFEKEDPMAEYLKYKEMILIHSFEDTEIISSKFVQEIGKLFKIALPFNQFVKESTEFN
ncbi:TIGR02453 family protein [Elizabethkingia anophelis]|nr:TIGR02453 family protein [Elizabethkingia anophelis]